MLSSLFQAREGGPEGVETRETLDALKRLNCDEARGYYISAPLPANAVRGWLEQSAWPLAPA